MSPRRPTSNRKPSGEAGSESHTPTGRAVARIQAKWYNAVAWTIITPVWAVGAFFLALGFLAVPPVLLDGKTFAAWGANATSKGRALGPILNQTGPFLVAQWTRLGARKSRWNPFTRMTPEGTAKPASPTKTIEEAQG